MPHQFDTTLKEKKLENIIIAKNHYLIDAYQYNHIATKFDNEMYFSDFERKVGQNVENALSETFYAKRYDNFDFSCHINIGTIETKPLFEYLSKLYDDDIVFSPHSVYYKWEHIRQNIYYEWLLNNDTVLYKSKLSEKINKNEETNKLKVAEEKNNNRKQPKN